MNLKHPNTGDSFTKNGIEIVVIEVCKNEVHMQRWRAGMDKSIDTDDDGVPDAAINLCRIDLERFWSDVEGAEFRAAE